MALKQAARRTLDRECVLPTSESQILPVVQVKGRIIQLFTVAVRRPRGQEKIASGTTFLRHSDKQQVANTSTELSGVQNACAVPRKALPVEISRLTHEAAS